MKQRALQLIELSLSAGAAAAEVLIKTGSTRTVRREIGGGASWTRTAEGGVALRLFVGGAAGGATGFASMCGPAPDADSSSQLVRAALDAARAPAARLKLPSGGGGAGRGLGIFDVRLHSATPADLEGLLDDAASEALRADPRVRGLDSASIAASSSEVCLCNSAGFEGSYRQTLVHLSLGVTAGDGGASVVVRRSRTARNLAAFSPALFGDETARLAVTALEGRPQAEGIRPALLAPAAAAEVLRAFSRTLAPPGPGAGPGAPVGSRLLTIIDDGRMPGGIASAPFDGEGVATRRTTVVSRGVFGAMLHDLSSAALCGAASTGNGVRASFRDAPRRMPTNFFIPPGPDSPADLMSQLRDGIWIQSLRPSPSMPAAAGAGGTFAALATGRLVVGGRPADPVAGVLVAWPIADLMSGIAGVGNDLCFGFPDGSFGSPSLLVAGIGLRAS